MTIIAAGDVRQDLLHAVAAPKTCSLLPEFATKHLPTGVSGKPGTKLQSPWLFAAGQVVSCSTHAPDLGHRSLER